MNQMKRSSIIKLIVSVVLVGGILVAGCTQETASSSGQSATTQPASAGQAQTVDKTSGAGSGIVASSATPDQAGSGDKPQFNESAGAKGARPEGMQGNGTHPSGTPPSGTPPTGS